MRARVHGCIESILCCAELKWITLHDSSHTKQWTKSRTSRGPMRGRSKQATEPKAERSVYSTSSEATRGQLP